MSTKPKSSKKAEVYKRNSMFVNLDKFKYRNIKDIYPEIRISTRLEILNIKKNNQSNDKKKDYYDLDEEFLFALIQPIFLLDKQKMQNTLTKLITESKMVKKLEEDLNTTNSLATTINNFIQNLTFRKFDKNSILFRNGEMDNKFYFIIKGRVSFLKPVKINVNMSLDDYILYLLQLKQKNEISLLNKVLKLNYDSAPIKNIEDIKRINTIIFKKKLKEMIEIEENELLTDNNDLEAFFIEYNQNFDKYDMSGKELKKLIKNRGKIYLGTINKEWDTYILEHCALTSDENSLIEPFESVIKEIKHNFIIYNYENEKELINSEYFGDFSLDEDRIIRNETVRFEEDTTISWISNDEYIDIISPQKKIEKKNDILRLNTSFCFKDISERIFKRNYYEMFIKKQCGINSIIFKPDTKAKSLYFIKQGKLALVLNVSIIEMQNLIQLIYKKLINVSWPCDVYQKNILSREYLKMLEVKYLDDKILKMKSNNKEFKMEIEKKRNFQISVFSDNEMVGLEEIYLQIPHFAKALVTGEKLFYNELPLSKFNEIHQNELRTITESYVQVSINRILSLMKRLYDIKQNFISVAKTRSNMDSLDEGKNNDMNIDYDYNIKLNINNNRTYIPQVNLVTKNNNNKKEDNDVKVILKKKRFKSPNKESSRQLTLNIKSAKKMRNNNLMLETNLINKGRAKSGKFNDKENKDEEKEDIEEKKKYSNIMIIGNRKINIKELKKEIKKYGLINNNEEIKEEKNSNDLLNNQNQYNSISISDHKTKKTIEAQNNNNLIKEKLNTINQIKSRKLKNEKISIQISDSSFNKNNRNKNSKNISNINYTIGNIPFIPISIKSLDIKQIVQYKQNLDLKSKRQQNINNSVEIVKTEQNSSNKENSNEFILPKIKTKIKSKDNDSKILNSNINNKNIYVNDKIQNIVKNFYSEMKKKGCIPLIVNKRSNTLFLRKYHKKYNKS